MKRRNQVRLDAPGRVAIVILGLTLGSTHSAGAAQIDVGVGTGCEAATIQGALGIAAFNGAATADEIRLTRTTTYTGIALEISDWDVNNEGALILSGGWDSCTDASASGRTVVSGSLAQPAVIQIQSPNETSVVTVRDLEIRDGVRGILAQGPSSVLVQTSAIRLNEGGIEVQSGSDLEVSVGSFVDQNEGVSFGGGISCVGSGSSVTLYGEVSSNITSGAGGGIYAASGCQVKFRSGARVQFNRALFGGGLFLSGGAWAENLGTGAANLAIRGNDALADGGGICAVDAGPQTLLGNAAITENFAGERGGGVALFGGARLQIERFNFEACANPPLCTYISSNEAPSTGIGSAVYVEGGSEFRMHQGIIAGNLGSDTEGALFYAEDAATRVHLEGVQVSSNRAAAVFRGLGGAEILGGFLTVVGNYYQDGSSNMASFPAILSGGAELTLHSSLLIDHQDFIVSSGATVHGRCLRLNTATGMTSNLEAMVGIDPRIVRDSKGIWRLQPDSPLIDSCDASVFVPSDSDYELDGRGFDHPLRANVLGAYDRGADELKPIFADGFASGNTNTWSDTTP